MSELAYAMRIIKKMPTAIQRFPTGAYGFVGAIPIELTEESRHGTPQFPPSRQSVVFATEQEAIDALLNIGVTRFQLSHCSWNTRSMTEQITTTPGNP